MTVVVQRWTSCEWAASDDARWWLGDASCRGVDPDVFFPERGTSYAEAEQVCRRCPVLEPCRAMTDRVERQMSASEVHGYYALETPRQRLARRKSGDVSTAAA
jgi:hypothetical protein